MITALTVGELGRVVTGRTPPKSAPEAWGAAYPFITPSDLAYGVRTPATERRLSEEGAEAFARIKLPSNSVCVTCIGATIGKMCLTSGPSFTNQQINSIVVDESRHDPRFVYYLLLPKTDEIRARAGGAATPIINKSSFSQLPIEVPSLRTQRRIAGILTAYDDLIENNTKRIKILEEMARALYREWFVHFRFPGHEKVKLVDSPLGQIPDGWEVAEVGGAFDCLGGGTPSKKAPEYWEGGTHIWYSPTDLTASRSMFIDDSNAHITDLGLAKSSAREFPPMCVMMTSRATLGVLAINTTPASTNQGFITCIPNDRFPLYWLYHWLEQSANVLETIATGATFKEITKRAFGRHTFVAPPSRLTTGYQERVESICSLVRCLGRQSRVLRETRDLLLPRLISGEIDVDNLDLPEAAE